MLKFNSPDSMPVWTNLGIVLNKVVSGSIGKSIPSAKGPSASWYRLSASKNSDSASVDEKKSTRNNIKYFNFIKETCFLKETLVVTAFILSMRSCMNPIGHIHPQRNLPKTEPITNIMANGIMGNNGCESIT